MTLASTVRPGSHHTTPTYQQVYPVKLLLRILQVMNFGTQDWKRRQAQPVDATNHTTAADGKYNGRFGSHNRQLNGF